MFIASYRNTEAGVKAIMAAKLAEERRLANEARQALAREQWERSLADARFKQERDALNAELDLARKAAHREAMGGGYRYSRTIEQIKRSACRVFGVTLKELDSERRNKGVVFARQFVAYWSCRLTRQSLPQIGRRLGGKDHTTIIHGKKAYREKRAAMGRNLREAR